MHVYFSLFRAHSSSKGGISLFLLFLLITNVTDNLRLPLKLLYYMWHDEGVSLINERGIKIKMIIIRENVLKILRNAFKLPMIKKSEDNEFS